MEYKNYYYLKTEQEAKRYKQLLEANNAKTDPKPTVTLNPVQSEIVEVYFLGATPQIKSDITHVWVVTMEG